MKSNVLNARERFFEIVVQDYSAKRNGHSHTYISQDGGNKRKVDVLPELATRTFLRPFKDNSHAMKWASRLGTVLSCCKVDPTYHLKKIEYLNVITKPVNVEIDMGELVMGKDFEVQQNGKENKLNIQINPLDKD